MPEFCNLRDDDCDGLTDEDYDIDFDPLNCGRCGTVCRSYDHAYPLCMLGDCDIACEAGWSNVNGDLADGCETTCVPEADPSETTCNGVDNDCDGLTDEDYASYECGVGRCVRQSVCNHGMPMCEPRRAPAARDVICDGLDEDCDGEVDEEGDCGCSDASECDDGNPCTRNECGTDLRCRFPLLPDDSACPGGICCGGACVDSSSDASHCGACAQVCGPGSTCRGGACACAGSLLNCDGNWGNGCEVNGASDPANCGACGNRCGAFANCSSGSCSCSSPYLNCNGSWGDGCEISLTSLTNCGACGRACDLPNASESCASGSCTLGSCNSGWGNCNGSTADGCETNMRTSTSCGTSCSSLANCTTLPYVGSASCSSTGSCVTNSCSSARAECNDVVSDGCERNLDDNFGTCSGAVSLGSVSGDTGGSTITRTLYGEMWYVVNVTENSTSGIGLSLRVRLQSPANVDYDLYVHGGGSCGSCVQSLTSGVAGGVDEVYLGWSDWPVLNDSRNIYIEVRFFSGSTTGCGEWTLTVTGNTGASVTC